MGLLRKMSIKTKLITLVAILSFIALGLGIYGLNGIKATEEGLKTVYNDRVIPLEQLKQVSDFYAVNIVDTSHKVRAGKISFSEGSKSIADALSQIDTIWKTYTSTYLTDEEKTLVNEVDSLKGTATTAANEIKQLMDQSNQKGLEDYVSNQMYTKIDPLTAKISELVDLQLRVAGSQYNTAVKSYEQTRMVMIGVIVVSILLGIGFATATIRIINHQIKLIKESVKKDEFGRVSIKAIEVVNRDELGVLADTLNVMTSQVRLFIENTHGSAKLIAKASADLTENSQLTSDAANEISKAIEEIAKGATDQARETEAGAREIDYMASSVSTALENVKRLNQATGQVDTLKQEGMEILKGLVAQTKRSDEAIRSVSEVIHETDQSAGKIEAASQMIKSISDQTNLLALNAAIEAARAGEAGRGFAVVAEEIRKLAEQSNSFTDEIAKIIVDLASKTETAVSEMDELLVIIKDQIRSVNDTNSKYTGISQAIDEVKAELGYMNRSLSDMESKNINLVEAFTNLSAISEENAAGAEQSTASIEEQTASISELADSTERLAKLADELEIAISGFEL